MVLLLCSVVERFVGYRYPYQGTQRGRSLYVPLITNNNIYIVVYSRHPYCCVNNIVLTLFLKQSKLDVIIFSLNVFHSHGAA